MRVDTRVTDIYNEPHDQLEQQERLTIEGVRERQEWGLVNNRDFGPVNVASPSMRTPSPRRLRRSRLRTRMQWRSRLRRPWQRPRCRWGPSTPNQVRQDFPALHQRVQHPPGRPRAGLDDAGQVLLAEYARLLEDDAGYEIVIHAMKMRRRYRGLLSRGGAP